MWPEMLAVQAINTNAAIPSAAVAVALGALYLIYCRILPKPLPGIPCNKEALRTPFGDLPSLIPEVRRTRDFMGWLQRHVDKHGSPLCQIFFLFPFWKPVVIVSDAREVQDILLRRTPKEFDRSYIMRTLLGGIAPEHHIFLPTQDKWKSHRRLLQDLMTPSFLRGVASGVIYQKATDLISLWEIKMDMAKGRPFSATGDIYHAALDAVMTFSFGDRFGEGAIGTKVAHLLGLGEDERASARGGGLDGSAKTSSDDQPMQFPDSQLDRQITTVLELANAVEEVRGSPFRGLKWWYMQTTRLRKPLAAKREFLLEQLEYAVSRLRHQTVTDESWVRSAVDHIVSREQRLAVKDGRDPDFTSAVILDEVFGFIVAGHDTTSTTLLWSIKILADNPEPQACLRRALQQAFPQAQSESRLPTNSEIHDTNIPYLDAVIEELFRCSCTIPFNSRDTVQDTTILGHFIPKGTTVFLDQVGSGVLKPPFAIDEGKRSETSRNARTHGKTGVWDVDDIGMFKPERWLKDDGEFDATSGPNLAFGLGLRGCFGRRLANLEMRTLLTLILWRFVLEPCPKELSGYEAIDGITHKPRQCFVRLVPAY